MEYKQGGLHGDVSDFITKSRSFKDQPTARFGFFSGADSIAIEKNAVVRQPFLLLNFRIISASVPCVRTGLGFVRSDLVFASTAGGARVDWPFTILNITGLVKRSSTESLCLQAGFWGGFPSGLKAPVRGFFACKPVFFSSGEKSQ
ncbi:hypothetical protein [Desulfatibacillum aliphaticivorans]|uniref:hypothetical protein n=1 Tax=Desulfatibacillum aliphaticivorans TaxID=218208 RepID=UPI0010A506DB|nr:hypothetical protein [Desulfatibacillum aliphaticivorans]